MRSQNLAGKPIRDPPRLSKATREEQTPRHQHVGSAVTLLMAKEEAADCNCISDVRGISQLVMFSNSFG